jgi:adenylate cyclase
MSQSVLDPGLVGYVPRAIADRLICDPSDSLHPYADAYDGAVLFADIVGFTALTESLMANNDSGAETLLSILDVYFGHMTEIIEALGGDIVNFAGDAVLATWREDRDMTLTARLAVQCGAALQTWLQSKRNKSGPQISTRIAVSVGRLAIASIGAPGSRRYHMLIGEPVRDVARAQHDAKPGEVLLCEAAWQLVADRCTGDRQTSGAVRLIEIIEPATPKPLPPLKTCPELERALEPRIAGFILDRLRARQHDWLAEFRTVTAMFVHLAARTSVLDRLDVLQGAVVSLQNVLQCYGTTIEQVEMDLDGIRAFIVFGLPKLSHQDNATRAINAAIEIRKTVDRLGFETAIGITSGRTFCGTCGGSRRHQYMVFGSATNLASRLMVLAGNETLCDAATRRAAGAAFNFAALPRVVVKGFDEPVPVFRPESSETDKNTAFSAYNVAFRRDLIGRAEEIRWFADHLDALGAGRGGLVAALGEAGIGKSRLLSHVAQLARARGFRVVITRTIEFERTSPYHAWPRVLAALATGDENADIESVRRAILDRLGENETLQPRAPLLNDIAPLGFEESPVTRLMTGQARLKSLHELLAFLIDQCAARSPMLMIFDDAQWLDPSSVIAIVALLAKMPTLLVIIAARPPDRNTVPFAGLPIADREVIRLAALQRDSIALLIREVLGVNHVPDSLIDFVVQRAQGNPFHSEELILAMHDGGLITTFEGECRYTSAVAHSDARLIPGSLNGLIVQRIDHLDISAQLVIKVASTIGRQFSSQALCHIHPIISDVPQMSAILATLVAEDFIYSEDLGSERAYEFKHVIIQEVAYGLLSYGQRRALHRDVARWIEHNNRNVLDAHYNELVMHWERSECYARAVRYLERAADHALQRYSNRECVDFITRAKTLSEKHELRIAVRRRARWERFQGDALHELSKYQQAYSHYVRALDLSGYRVPNAGAALMLATTREIAVQIRNRLGACPTTVDGRRGAFAAHVYQRLAEESYFKNDTLAVLHQTLSGLNLAEQSNAPRERMNGEASLAVGLGLAGLPGVARFYSRRALNLAEARGSETELAYIHLLTMVLALGVGDWDTVDRSGQQASLLFRKYGDRFRWQSSQIIRFYAHFSRGELREADELLAELRSSIERDTSIQVLAWVRSTEVLAELTRRLPDLDSIQAVEELIERGLERSERMLCHGIAAVARLHHGDTSAAIRHADEGLLIIRDSDPTVAGGYMYSAAGIAEVYLKLSERGDRAGGASPLLARASDVCRAFEHYARRLPSYRPAAFIMKGRLAYLSGRIGRAKRLWSRGLKIAEQLQMRREIACAMVELARHLSTHDTARSERLLRARDLFVRIGATFDAMQVDHLLST